MLIDMYRYLGFQQGKLFDQKQATTKIKERYIPVKCLIKSELNAGNFIITINIYVVSLDTLSEFLKGLLPN